MQIAKSTAFRTWIHQQFLASMLATPKGRAFALTQAGVAESTDEGEIFNQLRTRVEDKELARLVKWHADDEERHAKVFLAAADRQGVGRPDLPESVQILPLLNARIGVFGRSLERREDVMDAYLVLQVIEERAIEQFALMEPVLRRFDAQSADDVVAIGKDEQRHLRYCHAITRRYAPSEARRIARLREFRLAEASAFRDHQASGLAYILESGYLPSGKAWLWKQAIALSGQKNELPFTQHYHTTEVEPALAA